MNRHLLLAHISLVLAILLATVTIFLHTIELHLMNRELDAIQTRFNHQEKLNEAIVATVTMQDKLIKELEAK